MPKQTPTPEPASIEHVSLDTIKPYWRNPRHSEAAVDAVAKSIESYGFNQPIVVDRDRVIIAGHTRYKASQALGLDTVPIIVAAHLSADDVKAYRIADNKSAELAEWDYGLLVQELRELPELDTLQTFFPDLDLASIINDSSGTGIRDHDQDKIEEREGEMRDRFENASRDSDGDMVEVSCPECGEEFLVRRSEVASRFKGDGFTPIDAVMPDEALTVLQQAAEKVEEVLARGGGKRHENPTVWMGMVLEALAAEYLAGP